MTNRYTSMQWALAIVLIVIVRSVSAAGPGEGSVSRKGLTIGNCEVQSMMVKFDLDSLMGEPTVAGTYRWQGDGACELHYSTTVWLKLETDNSHGYVRLAPVVPDRGEWGYNTTGSPDWDEAVCGYLGTEKEECMTPKQAQFMWKNAGVTTFEVAVDADAINSAANSSGYSRSPGHEEPDNAASPEEDVSPVGTWEVYVSNGGNKWRTLVTLEASGDATYHQVGQADHYPARWESNGNGVTMKVYGTRIHYNRDDPAVRMNLTIEGNRIRGTQRNLLGNTAEFRVNGTKQ